MHAHNRKSSHRKGHAMVRIVFGFVLVAASALASWLSGVNGREAVIRSGIVMVLVVIGVSLHGRARSRRDWSAAWDTYAERDVSRESFESIPETEIFSWAGAN